MPPTLPPYALAVSQFPCRALAALAGRAPLGGEREVALACFVAARLATDLASGSPLGPELRAARSTGALAWLGTIALPAPTRAPLARAVEATGDAGVPGAGEGTARARTAAAILALRDAVASYLDGAALAELEQLGRLLGSSSAAAD